jgi:hypothetical protein
MRDSVAANLSQRDPQRQIDACVALSLAIPAALQHGRPFDFTQRFSQSWSIRLRCARAFFRPVYKLALTHKSVQHTVLS